MSDTKLGIDLLQSAAEVNGNLPVEPEPELNTEKKLLPVTTAAVKKEKDINLPFDDDDPFASLDWKDGVATLPGK